MQDKQPTMGNNLTGSVPVQGKSMFQLHDRGLLAQLRENVSPKTPKIHLIHLILLSLSSLPAQLREYTRKIQQNQQLPMSYARARSPLIVMRGLERQRNPRASLSEPRPKNFLLHPLFLQHRAWRRPARSCRWTRQFAPAALASRSHSRPLAAYGLHEVAAKQSAAIRGCGGSVSIPLAQIEHGDQRRMSAWGSHSRRPRPTPQERNHR